MFILFAINYRSKREVLFAMTIKWAFPDITKGKCPLGPKAGWSERMAEYKNATAMQWSVMWYSETSRLQDGRHGRRSLLLSRESIPGPRGLALSNESWTTRWRKRERWRTKRTRFGERVRRVEGKKIRRTRDKKEER